MALYRCFFFCIPLVRFPGGPLARHDREREVAWVVLLTGMRCEHGEVLTKSDMGCMNFP